MTLAPWDDSTFRLILTVTPGSLDLAIQSAQERADALGIDVSIVDCWGKVMLVCRPVN